jgi:hypothetical protein
MRDDISYCFSSRATQGTYGQFAHLVLESKVPHDAAPAVQLGTLLQQPADHHYRPFLKPRCLLRRWLRGLDRRLRPP